MASERPQIIHPLQGTAEATDTAEEVVQSAPGKTALVTVSQCIGLCDVPLHQRIPLYAVGAVPFGGAVQPMLFIGGKSNALSQRQFKATSVSERQQMRFQGLLFAARTPAGGCSRPATSDFMHLACASFDYGVF